MSTSGDASPRTVADQEWDASRLAEAALVGEPRDSLGLLLRTVAEMCGALGCVLWRANADADPWADPPRGKMSMLAGWFDTKFSPQLLAINKLQFEGASVAGKAVRSRKPAWSNDLVADKNPNAQQPFFTHHNITRTLAAPISYANRRVGAVNIYRRETSPAFSRADGALLARIAQLLPHLYRAVRHRAGFQLVLDVGEILRNHQRRPERATDPRTCQKRTLEQLCIALQKMFQCVEASVFLEAEGRPGIFTCACTTSQWPSADRVRQQEYSATFHDGFSGLALRTGEGFRVYDTQDCEDDVRDFQAKYPEFTGRKSRGLSNDVNTWLKVPEGWERPLPHSLIIAPLVVGQKTYGFLRCWVAEKGPPFFSLDDLELLRLIGEQFTHAVESWHEEIGVFASLSKARQDASTAKEEAMKAHREHRMDLENIHHQMKGPLWEAKRRIDDMLEELPRPPSPRELFAVRSMLHRSSLMSRRLAGSPNWIKASLCRFGPRAWIQLMW